MVCFDTPTSCATSSTARPASTCFKAAIISASLCLLRDMLIPLSFDEIIINFVRNQGSRSAGQMAKAYRTDVLGKKKFQEEIQQRRNALKPERVPCPLPGCDCTYEMYGYRSASLADYVATLQERLKREHPDHTSEVLAVNEFRKVPR